MNSQGPHDAYTAQCPSHPKVAQDENPEGEEEEMTT